MVVISDAPMLSTEVMQERVGGPIDMHGACVTQRHATTELRAGHAPHIAQDPEESCIDVDAVRFPVYFNGERHGVLTGL
jgi:hypothetical protein